MSTTSKKWLRTYKGPIAGAVVASIVLVLWIFDVAHGMKEETYSPLRRYAQGLAVSIESMLLTGKDVSVKEIEISSHFNRIIKQTPHLFFIFLKQDEKVICPAGELPSDTTFDTTFGERIEEETLILWKRVGDYFEPPREEPLHGGIRRPPPFGHGPPGFGPTTGWRRRPRLREAGGFWPPPERPQPPERPYRWGTKEGPQKLEKGTLLLVIGLSIRHGKRLTGNRKHNSIFLFAIFALLSLGILYAWTQSISASIVAAELEKEKTEREHLEELGLTAAGLAHETKNPIGIMFGLAQRIARHPGDAEEVRNMAEQIQDAADRASGRLGEFLKYSRLREPKIDEQDGQELIKTIVVALSPDFELAGVSLDVETEAFSFKCDKDMITQVLVNLLINSLHACKEGGKVLISLKKIHTKGSLTVKDNGCGISSNLINDIFKPYITGKENGHGLGLAVTKRIIELHEWTIDVASKEGQGTEITVGNIEVAPMEEA